MKSAALLIVLIAGTAFSQLDLRASMGINFISTPSLRDYLNQNYRSNAEYGTFNSAIGFSGEADYYFSGSFAAGFEFAYIYNSFTSVSLLGKRELTYDFFMPSLTAYYLISGTGYNFKFGGGAGPRFCSVNQSTLNLIESNKTSGMGFLLKADGNTLLSGGLYANIGVDLRYDLNGEFNVQTDHQVNLDALTLGVRLGLTYMFNPGEN